MIWSYSTVEPRVQFVAVATSLVLHLISFDVCIVDRRCWHQTSSMPVGRTDQIVRGNLPLILLKGRFKPNWCWRCRFSFLTIYSLLLQSVLLRRMSETATTSTTTRANNSDNKQQQKSVVAFFLEEQLGCVEAHQIYSSPSIQRFSLHSPTKVFPLLFLQ